MNSYRTKLIKWNQINKSNGMEGNKRNESNQIKSNQIKSNQIKSNQIKSNQTQEMITQHGFDSYEYHMKSIPQYLSTILYFDLD